MSDYFAQNKHALDYSKAMVPNMHALAVPLFCNTKITNFSYLRFNKNGSVLNLTTEERWIQFRFEQGIKYKILFKDHLTNTNHNTPYTYFWPKNTEDTLLSALRQYNIWNGCNIYISSSSSIEVFSFASSVENDNMENFYVNNLNLLRNFIIFFKEQLSCTMQGTNDRKNMILTDLKLPVSSSTDGIGLTIYNDLHDLIRPKRIYITEDFYLTNKELECCAYLIRGDNIKSIAQKVKPKLSPRTVETHINNAKLRANCSTKAKLIDLISSNRWIFDALLRS